MEHPTDASPADDVQPVAEPRRPWRAPVLTVMPLAHVTQTYGNTHQECADCGAVYDQAS